MDTSSCGGILEAKKIAPMADFHNAILREPICRGNGDLIPSAEPGPGLELNEGILAEYTTHTGD
jgi:L-alanine-DL-glutamate epimerase-like enolase superfamily enzyme